MLSLIALAAAAAAPVPAGTVSLSDPRAVVKFLQEHGYQAELDLTGKMPSITSGVGGWTYTLNFQNCTTHTDCSDLLLYAGWNAEQNQPTLEKINAFNRDSRFVRVYLDKENDPVIEMDVVFTDQQMSAKMFEENLDVWGQAVGRYANFLGMD